MRIRALVPVLLRAYVPALAVLGAATLLSVWKQVPLGNLTRDPANTFSFPWYTGVVSSFGILLWCATAAVCLFSAASMARQLGLQEQRSFLLAAGLLTSLLLFDDLFLFHEIVFPQKLHIPELATYGTYATLAALYLVVFRGTIARTDFLILLVAGGFLGLSTLADTLTNDDDDVSLKFLVEDGLKFLGIVGWFTYHTRVGLLWTRNAFAGTQGA